MPRSKILRINSCELAAAQSLSAKLAISPILAHLLINRGLKSVSQAESFLQAKPSDLLDPLSFKDMHKAVTILRDAASSGKKVMIFGDYDVDGITSLALIKGVFKRQKIDCLHYLPHRINEGYGLNKSIFNIIKEKRVEVLVTADCGISNHREIEELSRIGVKVILTDHHEVSENTSLPPAACVINPKVKGSGYKFRDLAGVGVAFKLCQAFSASQLLDQLDLVALGTIADSVALIGENRIIAKEGLSRLSRTKRPGLRALYETAGIKHKKFTSTTVAFIIGPRLNASGRMDSPEISLKLLTCTSDEEAGELMRIIEAHNRQRQKIESRIMEEAQDLINKEINFKEHRVIVIAKENWHRGVLGIVASKLADRFYRPAIVISLGEETCKGSARSIKNFHLFQALSDCRQFLHAFGGHAHAGGLTIRKENIDSFRQDINRLAHERLKVEDLMPAMDIDMEIGLNQLDEKTVNELSLLEPFGIANPQPLFLTRSLKLKSGVQVLGRETLKFYATDGKFTFPAIGFGMAAISESLMQSDCFDLIFTPRIDTWRDETSVLLEIKDIFLR